MKKRRSTWALLTLAHSRRSPSGEAQQGGGRQRRLPPLGFGLRCSRAQGTFSWANSVSAPRVLVRAQAGGAGGGRGARALSTTGPRSTPTSASILMNPWPGPCSVTTIWPSPAMTCTACLSATLKKSRPSTRTTITSAPNCATGENGAMGVYKNSASRKLHQDTDLWNAPGGRADRARVEPMGF